MAASKGSRVRRAAQEFVVIVVGVLTALVIDRWVAGIDERDRAEQYRAELAAGIRADSANLELRLTYAQESAVTAERILRFADADSVVTAMPLEFIEGLEAVSFYSPMEYRREAWDDLIATGSLNLIEDAELRRALSAFYNRTEWLGGLEERWEDHMRSYYARARRVQPAVYRVDSWQEDRPHSDAENIAAGERLVQAVRDDAALADGLAEIVGIYRGASDAYHDLLRRMGDILRMLENSAR